MTMINGIDRLNPLFIEPFCLFWFYIEVRGCSTSTGASGWFWEQSSVTQIADGTQSVTVLGRQCVWVINIILNSDTSDLAQTTSVVGVGTQIWNILVSTKLKQFSDVAAQFSVVALISAEGASELSTMTSHIRAFAVTFVWMKCFITQFCNRVNPVTWGKCSGAEDVNKVLKTFSHNQIQLIARMRWFFWVHPYWNG